MGLKIGFADIQKSAFCQKSDKIFSVNIYLIEFLKQTKNQTQWIRVFTVCNIGIKVKKT